MASLFENLAPRPLADRLRPETLEDIFGQDHLLSSDAPLGQMLANNRLTSLILWGPPGCGKTTLARILAKQTSLYFEPLSAVFSGVADLKKVFEAAKNRRETGRGTLLFVDEIHRFNRSQQDSFLPYVENGTVVLIGATTENPSFELNSALLSRCQLFVLKRLSSEALALLFTRAEKELGFSLPLNPEAKNALFAMSDGDGRYLLNMIEVLSNLPKESTELDASSLAKLIQKRVSIYDKKQDGHYNLISALHKSIRGSDPDASLYWFCRMLEGGEDPRYIGRRLIRVASEDVGIADPNALPQAIAALEAYERLGSPEGELALGQAVVYLATAPKSVSLYRAFKGASKKAAESGSLTPPANILNAPNKVMKQLGYGEGYTYDPETKFGFSGDNYFPEGMPRQAFYQPTKTGFEKEILKRLEFWDDLRKKAQE